MSATKTEIEVPVMDGKKIIGSRKQLLASSRATVIEAGPGEWENGVLVPPDPRLRPGVSILANGAHFMRLSDIKEMEDENLAFIPASMIVFVLAPEGMPAKKPVLVE